MGKKRRDGRAAKRGNNASSSNAEARNSHGGGLQSTGPGKGVIRYEHATYEGEVKDGKPHGKGKLEFDNGEVYDGDWKDDLKHGRGTMTFASGNVYDGEWKEDERHGKGSQTYVSGDLYDGQWKGGKQHGEGTYEWADGRVYEGQFANGQMQGWGTMKFINGDVYEGQLAEGKAKGKGTMTYPSGDVYEGQWVGGRANGMGTVRHSSGDVVEGIWRDGELAKEGYSATGEVSLPNSGTPVDDALPEQNREHLNDRTPRSQRSQQRRLENAKKMACEHCGVDDYHYKLRVCSGCNLALYCSEACQKAASRSHRRICDILSHLPSRESDRLVLTYGRDDKDDIVDLDAGLRYATKYMDNLKHLAITIEGGSREVAVKLSAKQLSSLLKSKKGALKSVFLLSDGRHPEVHGVVECDAVWRELHGLKQLRLEYMKIDVQSLRDIIGLQQDTLVALGLAGLEIDWSKAKNRRTIAQAVGSCKSLVKLDLFGCSLMDSDLKIMLHSLPSLRVLNLARDTRDNHEFTDNTCGLIARKCPALQELNLRNHDQLSVRGIRKIFGGCAQLRAFFTTAHKLSCNDVQSLLDIAPQLMSLSLDDKLDHSAGQLDQIIEATGGRTVLWFGKEQSEPHRDVVSSKAREKYEDQKDALNRILRLGDPEVANYWDCLDESR